MNERVPFIAGNWKMNLDHQQAIALVQKLAWSLKDAGHDYKTAEVAVFPPFTDLRTVQTLLDADKFEIELGAQDLSKFDNGAYTGEISGAFLKKLDVKYVLIGHSERRQYHAENDEVVQAKTAAAFRHGIIPVICVGETADERNSGRAEEIVCSQIAKQVSVLQDRLVDCLIAYEPVWAIGTGKVASAQVAQDMHRAIRLQLAEFNEDVASHVGILYGGSVKPDNAVELFAMPDIDGGLVGGASLNPQDFLAICQA